MEAIEALVSGRVAQELLIRNEYLAAENRLFRVNKELQYKGKKVPGQLIVRLTTRTSEPDGQLLTFTHGELEGW